tara:strand:+ start:46 stop:195 length:150 start_codon:yes stop_codon:yes gene_type:complete
LYKEFVGIFLEIINQIKELNIKTKATFNEAEPKIKRIGNIATTKEGILV